MYHATMHPSHERVLRYFAYSHLPPHLQNISRPFHDLAHSVAGMEHKDGAELTVALRKLLEAKDAAVRSTIE